MNRKTNVSQEIYGNCIAPRKILRVTRFFQTMLAMHRHNPIASNLKYNTFTNRASFVLHRVASIFLLHNKMAINEMNLFQRKTISHLCSTFCVRNLCILEIFIVQNCGSNLIIINVTTLFRMKMEIVC